ncbi:MAG: helix-turn-helix domain-containing protein, partial [Sulfurovum sp.]|nr:helix-turn-helix domain-containing protein [Sulfurovum sp.]
KWGFKHMGRFSAYYRELFRESPSETLKSTQGSGDDIMVDCVTRQEEMT